MNPIIKLRERHSGIFWKKGERLEAFSQKKKGVLKFFQVKSGASNLPNLNYLKISKHQESISLSIELFIKELSILQSSKGLSK